jgi:hypothetical protein
MVFFFPSFPALHRPRNRSLPSWRNPQCLKLSPGLVEKEEKQVEIRWNERLRSPADGQHANPLGWVGQRTRWLRAFQFIHINASN